jgi:signal transduction histidine kinase
MINLIQNAVESMSGGGILSLDMQAGDALVRGSRRPVATIHITDTGRGMAPEVCARLFDPFFTTKEGGTGLGLSIAARIVDKLGGELRFETEENRGTNFSILLPRTQEHED